MGKFRNFFRDKINPLYLAFVFGVAGTWVTGNLIYDIPIAMISYILFIRLAYGEWFYMREDDKQE